MYDGLLYVVAVYFFTFCFVFYQDLGPLVIYDANVFTFGISFCIFAFPFIFSLIKVSEDSSRVLSFSSAIVLAIAALTIESMYSWRLLLLDWGWLDVIDASLFVSQARNHKIHHGYLFWYSSIYFDMVLFDVVLVFLRSRWLFLPAPSRMTHLWRLMLIAGLHLCFNFGSIFDKFNDSSSN